MRQLLNHILNTLIELIVIVILLIMIAGFALTFLIMVGAASANEPTTRQVFPPYSAEELEKLGCEKRDW